MADGVKIRILGDDTDLQQKMDGIEKKAKKSASGASSVFRGMLSSQVITKGISMLVNGLKSAATTGMAFEAAMSQVAAISGATGEELQKLTDTARHYGETTKFTASEAAQALNYMALAGWDANQSTEALGGVLALAAASGMDLARASDAVTDYLSAFGMEASQAGYMADLMAYAQSSANTSASQLADAYGNCASSMHAAGQDIETTTAMLMALANQGMKGSEAGTQVSAVMRDLTQKMKNGSIQIGRTKVAVQDANGNFRDMNTIMADIGKATEGMGTAEKSAALMQTFSARSIRAVNTLLNEGVDAVDSYEEALRKSGGTAEAQARTMMDNLQGDIQVFKSALEALQITAGESMNGSMRSVVQEMTGLMEKLTKAGKTGGLSGIADAFIDEIPALLPKINAGLSKVLGSIGKKLPGLLKGIVGTIPDVLRSISDLTPELVSAVSEALAGVVEGVIGNLPQIVTSSFSGMGKTLLSLGGGIGKIIGSVFTGITGALKDVGLIEKSVNDVVDDALRNANVFNVEPVTVADLIISGNVDTTEYIDRIEGAKTEIRTAVDGLKLNPAEKAKLTNAILRGSGVTALELAFRKMGVYPTRAKTAAANISSAITTIQGVYTDLGIAPEVQKEINSYVERGNSLSAALQLYADMSPEEAEAAAARLQGGFDTISDTLNGLHLKNVDISDLTAACTATNGDIVAALKMLGMTDPEISAMLVSMDELSGSVSTKVAALFEGIKTAFTDYTTAGDKKLGEEAQAASEEYYNEIETKIDEWAKAAKDQLAAMGLGAENLAKKTAEIDAEAASMKATLDECRSGTAAWLSENAGAAKGVVEDHLAQLNSLLSQVENLEARIAVLTASIDPKDYVMRTAVEQGRVSNKDFQAQAMQLTYKEREKAVAEAEAAYVNKLGKIEDDYSKAMTEAAGKEREAEEEFLEVSRKHDIGDMTDSDFVAAKEKRDKAIEEAQKARDEANQLQADASKEAEDAYTTALKKADDDYNRHMEALKDGILAADPELAKAMDTVSKDLSNRNLADKLIQGITNVGGKGFTPEQLLDEMNLTQDDIKNLADTMGVGVDDLWATIENALKSEDPAQWLAGGVGGINLAEYASGYDEALAKALDGVDLDKTASVFKTALANGWLVNAGDINWSDQESVITASLTTLFESAAAAVHPDLKLPDGEAKKFEATIEETLGSVEPEPEVTADATVDVGDVTVAEGAEQKFGSALQRMLSGEKFTVSVSVEPKKGEDPNNTREKLVEAVQNSAQGTTFADMLSAAGIGQTDYEAMANAMGLDPEQLSKALTNAMKFDPISALAGNFDGIDLSSLLQPIEQQMSESGAESGTAFDSGAASGIGSNISLLVGEAIRAARETAAAFNGYLHIMSPSRVMMQSGRMFDLGVAKGIDEETSSVVRSAVRMADTVAGAANLRPRMDLSGITKGMRGAISDIADIESARDIALYLNGREMARASTRDYDLALNGYARRLNLGYGRG